jgi:hypothetical protein
MPQARTAALWIGSQELLELPDVEISADSSGTTTSLTLEGPWKKCLAEAPRPGQSISPYVGLVQRTRIVRAEGGKGNIHISMFDGPEKAETGGGKVISMPRYEIFFNDVEKALERHPRYNDGTTEGWGGETMESTIKIVVNQSDAKLKEKFVRLFGDIEEWEGTNGQLIQILKDSGPEGRTAIKEHGGTQGYLAFLEDFFKKWDAGIEAYVIGLPVARKTTTLTAPVAVGKTGIRQTPKGFGAMLPSGFQWLKSEDRCSWTGDSGTCEHVEEWKAADTIDHDLYPSG